jgi:hypothetical protein
MPVEAASLIMAMSFSPAMKAVFSACKASSSVLDLF